MASNWGGRCGRASDGESDARLTLKQVEGRFPDWKGLFPESRHKEGITVGLDAKLLKEAAELFDRIGRTHRHEFGRTSSVLDCAQFKLPGLVVGREPGDRGIRRSRHDANGYCKNRHADCLQSSLPCEELSQEVP